MPSTQKPTPDVSPQEPTKQYVAVYRFLHHAYATVGYAVMDHLGRTQRPSHLLRGFQLRPPACVSWPDSWQQSTVQWALTFNGLWIGLYLRPL